MTFNYARDHTSGSLAAGMDDWAVGVRKALQDKTVSRGALNVRHRQVRIYRRNQTFDSLLKWPILPPG